MTQAEFVERWREHYAEWCAIRDEMLDAGKEPVANDVTLEQYRRMNARGESVFAWKRLVNDAIEGRLQP